MGKIPVFNALDEKDRQRLVDQVSGAYARASQLVKDVTAEPDDEPEPHDEPVEVPVFHELIGIDPSVYRQINAALKSGKQHLMFYGPPGTGKTTLAQRVAGILHANWCMITGSADWTSQDVIGGYQPIGNGGIAFVPGVLLQNFDRPLIIDELNRCDIDKVIGPLFSVLSEQATTLPYRVDVKDAASAAYRILPKPKPGALAHEFAPKPGWRIFATINSIDKAALYQMSFALTRRFGWIYVDVPRDLQGFLIEFMRKKSVIPEDASSSTPLVLAQIWNSVNRVRPIGPAPIIDMLQTVRVIDQTIDMLSKPTEGQARAYIDGFAMYLLPMLDGISRADAEIIGKALSEALAIPETGDDSESLRQRLLGLAV